MDSGGLNYTAASVCQMNQRTTQAAATTTAALLCGVSFAASLLLWTSTATGTGNQLLAGITAAGLEVAKFLFIPAGLALYKAHKPGALACLALGSVLLVVSIAGTVGFLEHASTTTQAKHVRTTTTWQTLQNQLASVQKQVETYQQNTRTDAQTNYRARSYAQLENLRALEAQRSELLRQLATLETVSAPGQMLAMITTTATALALPAEKLRGALFWLLAALVDLCGIAALMIATQKPKPAPQKEPPAPHRELALLAARKSGGKTPISAATTNLHAVAANVKAGKYGNSPSINRVAAQTGIDPGTIKNIFNDLLTAGFLEKTPQRKYRLTNK